MARRRRRKSWHRLRRYLPKVVAGLVAAAVLAGGAYFITKKTPEDYLKAGIELHQKGDSKGAAIELKNYLQAKPDSGEARLLLGRIHFANNEFPAAEKELKKAIGLGVKDADLLPLMARTLLLLNEPKRILDEIKENADAPPESNAAILALRARAELMLNNPANAEKLISDADARATNHVETLVSRAILAVVQKNLDQSLAFTEQALAKSPQRADLWVMKGDLLRGLKREPDALTAYAKAIAIEPGNIPARLANAEIHLAAAALDKAKIELDSLLKLAPANLMGRYLSAFVDFRQSRFAEADANLAEVLRTTQNFLPAHLLAGAVKLALGNREAAKSHLEKVLAAAPQHPLARKLMAATLADMGDLTQARSLLASFGDVANDPVLSALKGDLALRQGDYQEARKQLESVGEGAQQSSKHFTELAASRMGTGDQAGAIQALTKAAELDTASAKPDVLLVLTHLKEKRFDEAFKVVEKLAKERPNDPLIENLRGTIHISREDSVQARASFSKALQIKPSYFPAASNLALLDMRDKNPKAARTRFEALLKQAPTESRAWLALAALDANEKNEAGYIKNLEQAKKADAKSIQAHVMLSRYWLEKKDAGKAIAAAREGLDATGRGEFHEFIGLAQLLQKDTANALASFSRWAKTSPNNPMAHFRLAQSQMQAKAHKDALNSFDKALSLRPDFAEASASKALLLGQMGRAAEATKLARELQSKTPKAATGYLVEAEILFNEKKYPESGKLFAKASQVAGQGQPLVRAYLAYAAAGQPAEGEKLLEQWLKTKPNDGVVRHQLAQAQLNSKRLKESAENYRILARANPRDLTAYNNLAWILGELKDPGAIAAAEQALKLAPNQAAIQDTYGWLLANTGQAEKGLPYLREALKTQPDAAEIRWHLAATLAKTGDKRGALAELDRLLSSRVAFPQEAEARALLQQLRSSGQ
jgi:putative PEP-CTERM system TPR-repeat lipoprotein